MTFVSKQKVRLLNRAKESINSATVLLSRPDNDNITMNDSQAVLNAASQCQQAARDLMELYGVLSCQKSQLLDKLQEKKNV